MMGKKGEVQKSPDILSKPRRMSRRTRNFPVPNIEESGNISTVNINSKKKTKRVGGQETKNSEEDLNISNVASHDSLTKKLVSNDKTTGECGEELNIEENTYELKEKLQQSSNTELKSKNEFEVENYTNDSFSNLNRTLIVETDNLYLTNGKEHILNSDEKRISSIRSSKKNISKNIMVSNISECENIKQESTSDASKSRKRKWISKKQTEAMLPILSISSDSLKNLISDVKPVPLSDISLDSPLELEIDINKECIENSSKADSVKYHQQFDNEELIETRNVPIINSLRSPSPSKNEANNLLYITNLVRPFTVLQLKGLLARTGKIKDNGFWIDRIKSKCYVEYETRDEAIETRHALHGIRWPSSNPKCLNVEFGRKDDYMKAILSVVDNNICGQENNLENNGVSKISRSNEKKIRPVREWDVGKINSFNRENGEVTSKLHSEEFRYTSIKDPERNDVKQEQRKFIHNKQVSDHKLRDNDNDPPLRLLDDLFRKTQTTPCIYWLPLTPEQITDKYVTKKNNIDEHCLVNEGQRKCNKEGEKPLKVDKTFHRSRSLNKQRY